MRVIADTHTHTLACSHAYSTLIENAASAQKLGLRFLCSTEHGPTIPGAPQYWHFLNHEAVPHVVNGVEMLMGSEVNITDFDGSLDLDNEVLAKLDWVIASYHPQCIGKGTKAQNTAGWLAVAANPDIDVIGHSGDARFDFDHETCVRAFAEHGKIVEVNNHSFTARPGSAENCADILKLCKKYSVPVVASSDAHFAAAVGHVDQSLALLEEVEFPEELILNTDVERFRAVAERTSGRKLELSDN